MPIYSGNDNITGNVDVKMWTFRNKIRIDRINWNSKQ